ncbi:MAG: patatin-like phospholipase family protein [Kiritimatiellae bacterium]|nr:patatin-like phospholipase family protein [Kiritimatiellia bacterium]
MKIGLALGGGGAKGLAHIPMFTVLDELKVTPHRVTGTSIGAIMGALYCSGLSGNEIKDIVKKMILPKKTSLKKIFDKDALKWIDFIDLDFKGKGILKGDNFINFLHEHLGVSTFEELKIPLSVVAADFWTGEQVILNSGELLPAIKASMGLPGVFSPITIDDRILIDGGGVNPVPHDLITDCDKIIAIDVMGVPDFDPKHKIPNLVDSVLGMFDLMQTSIIREKLIHTPPDIYIKPDIHGIDILDFYKAEKVIKQALPASDELKLQLEKMLKTKKHIFRHK